MYPLVLSKFTDIARLPTIYLFPFANRHIDDIKWDFDQALKKSIAHVHGHHVDKILDKLHF